ncbi:MAG: helix-turn-helix domain-containing protein [Synergistaceae bacterium]|nr:helix-turn-helix domain-containing protein [Synergistaceae bacterium]
MFSYYFARLFKKETGYTPHKYVLTARINAAKFYLKRAALSVREISLSRGFSSERGLHRVQARRGNNAGYVPKPPESRQLLNCRLSINPHDYRLCLCFWNLVPRSSGPSILRNLLLQFTVIFFGSLQEVGSQ